LPSLVKLYELRLFADIWQAGCVIPFLCPCEQKLFGSSSARSYKGSRGHTPFSSSSSPLIFRSLITISKMGLKNILFTAVALAPAALCQQTAWGQCKFWKLLWLRKDTDMCSSGGGTGWIGATVRTPYSFNSTLELDMPPQKNIFKPRCSTDIMIC
jgi:hypothetical protein